MESGEFSRGRESIRAERQHRAASATSTSTSSTSSASATCSARCRPRCATTPPSWTASTPTCPAGTCRRWSAALFTDHFGLVSDFLSECWTPAARREPACSDPGTRQLRRRAERARHHRGQPDGQRPAEAALPGPRRCRSPTRTSSGPCAWRWSAGGGSRSSRSASAAPSSATRTSATRWARTASSSSSRRPSCRARTRSAPTRCRRARSGRSARAARTRALGLYRIDVNEGPGSGVQDHQRTGARAVPRERQVRRAEPATHAPASSSATATRASTSSPCSCAPSTPRGAAAYLGLPALLAFCSALLGKSLKGGLVAVGGLNLGGGLDPVYNAVSVAELAVEKGATTLLIPISARRQLNELSDEMATKISILFYADAREALIKALGD